jgi:hypothetical protein
MGPLGISLPNVDKALDIDNVGLWKKELDDEVEKRSNGTHLVQETTAIVTDSCVWDILEDLKMTTSTVLDGSPEWPSHRMALAEFLRHIHQTLPNATVFWKSCTSVHIHIPILQNPTNEGMHRRIKCMSTHRAFGLYSVQKDLIQKEILLQEEEARLLSSQRQHKQRLFFLDVYPAYYLSAYRSMLGDGRHYMGEMNRQVVSWFANAKRVKEILNQ